MNLFDVYKNNNKKTNEQEKSDFRGVLNFIRALRGYSA